MWAEPGFALYPAGAAHHRTGRPLPARYLVAAIAAHCAVLALWPRPLTALRDAVPRLEVLLHPVPTLPTLPASTVATPRPSAAGPASGSRRTASAEDAARQPSDRVGVSPYPAATVNDAPPLADEARAAARLAAASFARDPMAPIATAKEAISPLARATARGPAGEKLLADGLVQITNPDGSRYCLLRPPPVANRDGPLPVLSIPMNCPD